MLKEVSCEISMLAYADNIFQEVLMGSVVTPLIERHFQEGLREHARMQSTPPIPKLLMQR